jgi:hypothetical protein
MVNTPFRTLERLPDSPHCLRGQAGVGLSDAGNRIRRHQKIALGGGLLG